jgi:putative transposase
VSRKKNDQSVRRKYEYIKSNSHNHDIRMKCRLLGVARSGYYSWLEKPESDRAIEDKRLLRLIKASFAESQGVYGAPRIFLDLREAAGEKTVSELSRDTEPGDTLQASRPS